jgi:nucleotide-binding universal stress UspA family protein
MYKRILVAIDDSPTAQKALEEAIALSHALGATLCIMHGADESALAQHGMGLGSYIDIDKVKGEIRTSSLALLDQAVAQALATGCQAEQKLVETSDKRIAEMINEVAGDWQADLVVVGTHGRRGFERFLVGSVAENLVRMVGTSLMLVRGQ